MKVPVTLNVVVLAVVATLFYTWVGQLVPQKEVHPPEVVEMSQDISTAEMVDIGAGIFNGKGLCITCHNGSARFPDLAGIATRADRQVPGLDQVQYLAQSLYEPEAFIVPGFAGGMPAMDKPPIGLSDDEIKAVIAYLQTLGGEATITLATTLDYAEGAEATSDVDPPGGEDVAGLGPDQGTALASGGGAPATGAAQLVTRYGCDRCHGFEAGQQGSAVSLAGVGGRLTAGQILQNLTDHQPPLDDTYSSRVTLSEVRSMSEYLAGLQGGQG
jgi:mono/diheme cytochrome c family protein